jgi:hypothetical protein
MKQGRGDGYILSSLTNSDNSWHKGWFYLRNDLEFAAGVHWEFHRADTVELDPRSSAGGAGEDA